MILKNRLILKNVLQSLFISPIEMCFENKNPGIFIWTI